MKPETISQARNPLLAKALPALQRAARRARLIASQTGTKFNCTGKRGNKTEKDKNRGYARYTGVECTS